MHKHSLKTLRRKLADGNALVGLGGQVHVGGHLLALPMVPEPEAGNRASIRVLYLP